MTALEIILLLIGIICVAVSFIFFIKLDGENYAPTNVNVELSQKQKDDIKAQIATAFEEKLDDMEAEVNDRTETALEKLSNQKIQELSEYSETVLGEINRNHTEVMFLYDMLNEKSKEVHNNVRDISLAAEKLNAANETAAALAEEAPKKRTARTAKSTAAAADTETADSSQTVKSTETARTTKTSKSTKTARSAKTTKSADTADSAKTANAESDEAPAQPKRRTARKTAADSTGTAKGASDNEASAAAPSNTAKQSTGGDETASEAMQFMLGGNKKDAILSLHREGRSNVEIAKTLGLGMGEVKLVIDLFKGQK